MPWWRTPMFSNGRSVANGSPQIDRCGLPYIGASVTSGRVARRSVWPRMRPVAHAERRARAQEGRLRSLAIDRQLEPQDLVPARHPEQPVDRVFDLRVIGIEHAALVVDQALVVVAEGHDRVAREVIEDDDLQQAREI